MKNNILNELRTPVFLVNKYNKIKYINEIGEEFFGVSSYILIGKKGKFSFNELDKFTKEISSENLKCIALVMIR